MRLSTSTNLHAEKRGGQRYSPEESIEKCSNAGFKILDMNFCATSSSDKYLLKDNWQEYIQELKEFADAKGVEFSQSHAVFYDNTSISTERAEFCEMLVDRCIIASGILGVKWIIIHPLNNKNNNYNIDSIQKENVEYYKRKLEVAHKHNVGIAIENMLEFPGEPFKRCYCTTEWELCRLIDELNDPLVGACWDFGHANIMQLDQAQSLRIIGKRLKATHVDDNRGVYDDHVAPFHGDVPWEELMPVLTEIGYEGDFTYEIHGLTDQLPDALRVSAMRHAHDIGEYLLSLR